MNHTELEVNEQKGKIVQLGGILEIASPQNELPTLLIEKHKNVGVALAKEASVQVAEETLAEAFEMGFHSANTGVNSAFSCFLEMALVKTIHVGALDLILARISDRPLQSDALVSALVKKIGVQSLHSQVIWVKGMRGGKIRNVTIKDDPSIANLFPLNTKFSSKALDADSVI